MSHGNSADFPSTTLILTNGTAIRTSTEHSLLLKETYKTPSILSRGSFRNETKRFHSIRSAASVIETQESRHGRLGSRERRRGRMEAVKISVYRPSWKRSGRISALLIIYFHPPFGYKYRLGAAVYHINAPRHSFEFSSFSSL